MQIYKFNSILKPVLWGGDKLVAFKRLPTCDEPIGESWELSAMPGRESVVAEGPDQGLTLTELIRCYGADLLGEDVYRRYGDCFPLLIKFIDAKRDLSIQVHPGEEMARERHGCSGKNEMWYILDADEGAVIRTGFSRSIQVEEFDQYLADGMILDVVNETASKPGDVFFIPAGQIHTIGAGNLLVEIQQSSHIDEAREALDFAAREGQVTDTPCMGDGLTQLVSCDQFEVLHLDVAGGYTLHLPAPHSFVALVCIHGEITLRVKGMPPATLCQGETALVPAVAKRVVMDGTAQLLLATVPPQIEEK